MHNINKIQFVMLFFSINILIITKQNLAIDQIAGVSPGDFFYYEMYGYFISDDPNMTINIPSFEANNTDWVKIEITNISSTIIHHTYTLNFYNGTQEIFEGQSSILNSSGLNQDFKGVPICPANLEKGDMILSLPLKIKTTLKWTYPSGNREVNYVQWNESDDIGSCYFDKKTGMLLDLNRTHLYTNPITNQTIKKIDIIKMIQSSLWTIQPSNPIVPLLIILVSSSLMVIYLIRRKYKIQSKKKNIVLKKVTIFSS